MYNTSCLTAYISSKFRSNTRPPVGTLESQSSDKKNIKKNNVYVVVVLDNNILLIICRRNNNNNHKNIKIKIIKIYNT